MTEHDAIYIAEIEGRRRTLIYAKFDGVDVVIGTDDGGSTSYVVLTPEQTVTFANALIAALSDEKPKE